MSQILQYNVVNKPSTIFFVDKIEAKIYRQQTQKFTI